MKAGSFFPGTHYSSLYAMAGDDCSLFFDLETLTPKQQQDHQDNIELTAMLQVALSCIGHSQDHLALYENYQEPELQRVLMRYHDFFKRMVDDVVPVDHFSYHPPRQYYESVASMISNNPGLTDVANLYMSSGSNAVIHRSDDLLAINRNVNSKKHFAENAPDFGIPVPDTLITTKAELRGDLVNAFFKKHNNRIVAKLLGLAGARNVTMVDSVDECAEFVTEYEDNFVILLQERLDLDFYSEMTVDLIVSNDDIKLSNVRKILFADGVWVGNLIGDAVSLTDEQWQALKRVGEYARHHGYVTEEGSNLGIDYFVGKDGSVILTEINARWTGGLFPAEILRQTGTDGRNAVPFFDLVLIDKRDAYVDFLDRYLIGEYEGDFAMAPFGFGCFPIQMDGQDFFYTWQAVVGDLNAFKAVKRAELGDGAMVTADIITLD